MLSTTVSAGNRVTADSAGEVFQAADADAHWGYHHTFTVVGLCTLIKI